jgi:D-3-phosphoglycerate dehydrogenase
VTSQVAIVGTRYPDFTLEMSVLADLDVEISSGVGGSVEDLVHVASSADVVIAGSRPQFTAEVLERLQCRAIVRSGIGLDSIDMDAADRLGYTVALIPDYGTEAVSQHTLAMILAATRRLGESDRIVREGNWGLDSLRPLHLPSAMTAGVVGFGRIGTRVAELLLAVGFGSVLAYDAYTTHGLTGVEHTGLPELLERADVVSLHSPPPADRSALIGVDEIASMKAGSVLVNTARGSLIDPSALAAGLANGQPRLACLDVFDPEPPDLAHYRDVMDRVSFSPHTAWYTEESQAELRRKSAEETRRILSGHKPLNQACPAPAKEKSE